MKNPTYPLNRAVVPDLFFNCFTLTSLDKQKKSISKQPLRNIEILSTNSKQTTPENGLNNNNNSAGFIELLDEEGIDHVRI